MIGSYVGLIGRTHKSIRSVIADSVFATIVISCCRLHDFRYCLFIVVADISFRRKDAKFSKEKKSSKESDGGPKRGIRWWFFKEEVALERFVEGKIETSTEEKNICLLGNESNLTNFALGKSLICSLTSFSFI